MSIEVIDIRPSPAFQLRAEATTRNANRLAATERQLADALKSLRETKKKLSHKQAVITELQEQIRDLSCALRRAEGALDENFGTPDIKGSSHY